MSPGETIQIMAAEGAGGPDDKMMLRMLGSWSDMVRSPCECCGTPLVLIRFYDWPTDTYLSPQWHEVVRVIPEPTLRPSPGHEYLRAVFGEHGPVRCREMRQH